MLYTFAFSSKPLYLLVPYNSVTWEESPPECCGSLQRSFLLVCGHIDPDVIIIFSPAPYLIWGKALSVVIQSCLICPSEMVMLQAQQKLQQYLMGEDGGVGGGRGLCPKMVSATVLLITSFSQSVTRASTTSSLPRRIGSSAHQCWAQHSFSADLSFRNKTDRQSRELCSHR